MAGLSRRQFLTRATALAAAIGVPLAVVGAVGSQDAVAAVDAESTLNQTIL